MKGEKVPTNRIRQDENNPDYVILTTLSGEKDKGFYHPNGFGQEPRILKEKFKECWWQVKPYN